MRSPYGRHLATGGQCSQENCIDRSSLFGWNNGKEKVGIRSEKATREIVEAATRARIDDMLPHFFFGHLPSELQAVSQPFHTLANVMATNHPTSAQTLQGLQRLLEAKDCAVRAAAQSRKR